VVVRAGVGGGGGSAGRIRPSEYASSGRPPMEVGDSPRVCVGGRGIAAKSLALAEAWAYI